MIRSKHVSFRLEAEWLKGLAGLAGTFGVSAEEVIRLSLPDPAVVGLFFQCRDYLPQLRWDEVAEVGRSAIREHLRTTYREGLEQHLARLGLSLEESSADEVEAARTRALNELRADPAHPLSGQVPRAQEDSVYLGRLYDAWKRAKAGEPGYAIAQVDIDGMPNTSKAWAVLKDNRIV